MKITTKKDVPVSTRGRTSYTREIAWHGDRDTPFGDVQGRNARKTELETRVPTE